MPPVDSLKIKDLREGLGLTLEELADKVGVSANQLSKIERGAGTRPKTLKRLAAALEVGADTLRVKKGLQEEEGSADKFNEVAQVEMAQKADGLDRTSFFEIDLGTDSFGQAVSDLREIFNSGDRALITAILANLFTFKRATRREQEIAKMKSENQALQETVQSLASRLTTLEEKINK